jgi:DNA-binding CsgD family transcriptional regulator
MYDPTILSNREKQVVELIVQAKLNKEIAHEMQISEGTVKEYLYRIYRKVGATNRTGLAMWAVRGETMKKQKKLSLKDFAAMSEQERADYMNSQPAEEQARLLGLAATQSLNDAGDEVLGN